MSALPEDHTPDHARLLRNMVRAADDLDRARELFSLAGARQDPPCQACLAASRYLSHVLGILWLLRWHEFPGVSDGAR